MKTPSLRRSDWLDHALEVLLEEGIDGLRVEPLARSLGVTKGSFYWHFRDRDDLLDSVLEYWVDEMTVRIRDEMQARGGAPEQRLWDLMCRLMQDDRSRFELAIRSWAAFDPKATAAVRGADHLRLECLAALFLEMGFDSDEAHMRARTLMGHVLAEPLLCTSDEPDERMAQNRLRHAMLTARATPSELLMSGPHSRQH